MNLLETDCSEWRLEGGMLKDNDRSEWRLEGGVLKDNDCSEWRLEGGVLKASFISISARLSHTAASSGVYP